MVRKLSSYIKRKWSKLSSKIIIISAILGIIAFLIAYSGMIIRKTVLIINISASVFKNIVLDFRLIDIVFLVILLGTIIYLILVNNSHKKRILHYDKRLKEIDEKVNKIDSRLREIRIIKLTEEDFKKTIIDAVHEAGFDQYKGLYHDLKDEISFEIINKGKKYIISARYLPPEREENISSEQVENYIKGVVSLGIPHIIVSNASDLTPKARETLENFNRTYNSPILRFVFDRTKNGFISKIKIIMV